MNKSDIDNLDNAKCSFQFSNTIIDECSMENAKTSLDVLSIKIRIIPFGKSQIF